MKKKILYGLVLVLIVMQFIRPDREVQIHPEGMAFHEVFELPTDLENNLKAACYDCHSHESKYPWYAEIAPVSWWIQDHIKHGRGHLNFSEWEKLDAGKKGHKLEECIEELKEGHMPPSNYLSMHPEAEWSDEELQAVLTYFDNLRKEHPDEH